jgi:hypothetical protein
MADYINRMTNVELLELIERSYTDYWRDTAKDETP